MTSFTTDYATAYRLLRQGRQEPEERVYSELRTLARCRGLEFIHQSGVMSRVRAAIFAFRLAKQMRGHREMFSTMFGQEEEATSTVVNKRNVTLFPITVNRTVVKMRDPNPNESRNQS